jgi:hypothetical protein
VRHHGCAKTSYRAAPVAIEKSIRAHSASASMIRRARGAFPTIRISAGVRMSGQTLLQERRASLYWPVSPACGGLDVAGGRAIVAMVEAADLRRRDDTPDQRRHHRACDRHILAERKMRTGAHVLHDVIREHPIQPRCAENDDVIEALTSDRADDAFQRRRSATAIAEPCGPPGCSWRRSWSRRRQTPYPIVHEILGRVVFRKGVAELLCGPGRGGVFGDRHVNDPSTVVRCSHSEDQEWPATCAPLERHCANDTAGALHRALA